MTDLPQKYVKGRGMVNVYSVHDSPDPGTEWVIRYRVLGPSAVWEGMTVTEIVGGPKDGHKAVLNNDSFAEKLERKRKARA